MHRMHSLGYSTNTKDIVCAYFEKTAGAVDRECLEIYRIEFSDFSFGFDRNTK